MTAWLPYHYIYCIHNLFCHTKLLPHRHTYVFSIYNTAIRVHVLPLKYHFVFQNNTIYKLIAYIQGMHDGEIRYSNITYGFVCKHCSGWGFITTEGECSASSFSRSTSCILTLSLNIILILGWPLYAIPHIICSLRYLIFGLLTGTNWVNIRVKWVRWKWIFWYCDDGEL